MAISLYPNIHDSNFTTDLCLHGQYRTSSYVIYVDLPNNRDQWLIVHGYTGAYDVVDSDVVAFLKSRETQKLP